MGLLLRVGNAGRDNTGAEDKSENIDSELYMRFNVAEICNFAKETVNFQVCQGRQIAKTKTHD